MKHATGAGGTTPGARFICGRLAVTSPAVKTRGLCLLGVLLAPLALAEEPRAGLGVQVLEVQPLPEAVTRRAQHAAAALLQTLCSLQVVSAPPGKPGAPRRSCSEAGCQREAVLAAGDSAVVLLSLRATRPGVAFEVSFWLDAQRLAVEQGELELEAPERALRPALSA